MSKKTIFRNYEYDDEDDYKRNQSKKKMQQERQRKLQRNMKNQFRSKSFDPSAYQEEFEDDGR